MVQTTRTASSLKKGDEMLKTMKDKALSTGAKVAINQQISKYGKVTQLQLNSKFKSIKMDILLDGESDSVSVSIEHYEITEENHLKINGITTSRKWLNSLTYDYIEGKEIPLPVEYATMLKALV